VRQLAAAFIPQLSAVCRGLPAHGFASAWLAAAGSDSLIRAGKWQDLRKLDEPVCIRAGCPDHGGAGILARCQAAGKLSHFPWDQDV